MSVSSQHRHSLLIKGVTMELSVQLGDSLGAPEPPFLASSGEGQ